MAYEMVMPYHLHMPSYFLETFTEYPYVKRNYYKILCNEDTFVREREDKFLGRIKYLRSSSDLDSAEMSLTIERFRNFSSAQCGIYKNELPDDGTEKHGRFVGKLYKKIKRQIINQLKQ